MEELNDILPDAPEEFVVEEQQQLDIEDVNPEQELKLLPTTSLFDKELAVDHELYAVIVGLSLNKTWKKYQLRFKLVDDPDHEVITNLSAENFNNLVMKYGPITKNWIGKKVTITGERFTAPKRKGKRSISDGIQLKIR